MLFTGVYVEKSRRQYPRWVAVFKTSYGCQHITLPFTAQETSREDATEFALAEYVGV